MHVNTSDSTSSQVWYCNQNIDGCSYFPFYYPSSNSGFNISWPSGTTDIMLWPTVAKGVAWIDSIQVSYTNPFVLASNTAYRVLLTVVGYRRNKIDWLFLEPRAYFSFHRYVLLKLTSDIEIISQVSQTTGTTATFTIAPFQQVVVQQDLTSQSVFVLIGSILSNVGGIFAFIDGVYAIIFGRTVLSIVMGKHYNPVQCHPSQKLNLRASAQDPGPSRPLGC